MNCKGLKTIVALAFAFSAHYAFAQLNSGHASEQAATRVDACEKTTERARSVAGQHKALARREGKKFAVELLDIVDDECKRCNSEQIYRNPLVWTCAVRWRLVPE